MPVKPSESGDVPSIYVTLADADVLAGVDTTHTIGGRSQPARRLIVGVVGASGVTLTRPDGTVVVMSAAQVIACNGIITRQFVHVQSADSTSLGVDY